MTRLREAIAALLSISFLFTSASGASSLPVGTVVYADHANVGATAASVGTTVFGGDKLSTQQTGSVQIRTASARLLLAGSSVASVAQDAGAPAAILASGSATFSTSNARAFALYVGAAVIRPNTDNPTVGQVTLVDSKQIIVKSTRGSLAFSVGDETRVIPEGVAYRVMEIPVDAPDAPPPAAAGSRAVPSASPIRAGRSKFVFYAIFVVAALAVWAVHEALESPDRP